MRTWSIFSSSEHRPTPCARITGLPLSAAEEGYHHCCEVLLRYRANIHAVDNRGRTALHLASQQISLLGNTECGAKTKVSEILLNARTDPNAVDERGQTAEEIALAIRNNDVVGFLRSITD
mmetsp:Transcript_14432/g.32791  ORF Transcript_14432/g.32791 Transcript_14432/m.32791 type:complete len:121 (-) Transcript_14432:165-527(-)